MKISLLNILLVAYVFMLSGSAQALEIVKKAKAETAPVDRSTPRILFNSDGGSITLGLFAPPITPKQLCRAIDELEGTQVDVFIHCLNVFGGDMYSHRTKVGEMIRPDYLQHVPEAYRNDPLTLEIKRYADNARAILDAGLDPVDILAKRAHELGMRFWTSSRMNDVHEDHDDYGWASLRTTFKKEHPELLIGSPHPNPAVYGHNFTWAFDYARPEVRDRRRAIIAEACRNYDLDGFELNFQRGPFYFKPGKVKEGMPLMTDFLRKVRAETREIARKKKRPFTLAVRVPPTFAEAESIGLDVRTWIREGLADLFIPMDSGYLDMTADIRDFVEAARGTNCRIFGGIETTNRSYGPYQRTSPDGTYLYVWGPSDIRIFRAAALALYHQGAEGIYLFNYDSHRRKGSGPYTEEEIQILKEIGDRRMIANKEKHYFITRHDLSRTPEEGGTRQLPVVLNPGKPRRFQFVIGDDLTSTGHARSVRMVVTLNSPGLQPSAVSFQLNDRAIEEGTQKKDGAPAPGITGSSFVVTKPAIRTGMNSLVVSLDRAYQGTEAIRIEKIEFFID